MQVIQFDSHDAMRSHLRAAAEAAHRGLHSEQDRLTYGDYWVQFHDIANFHVIFGRIDTLEEVRDGEVNGGATATEADAVVAMTANDLVNGMMYGTAYDRFNPDGELGNTHKAHVWPIEERLFNAAAEARWDIRLLPASGKVLLEIAFRAMRAHVRSGGQD